MKPLSQALDQLASPQVFVPCCQALFRFCRNRRGSGLTGDLSAQANPEEVKRILVVKLDRIGDVILALPFLRELRKRFPQARISLVADKRVSNLMEHNPYIDEFLSLTCKDWSPSSPTSRWKDLLTVCVFAATKLWCRRFDLAITLSWDADNHYAGAIAYLSGAAMRLGYSEQTNEVKRVANANYDLLYTHVLNEPDGKHEVEHNLYLITALGGTPSADSVEIQLQEEDERFAKDLLCAPAMAGNGPLVAVCPSAAVPYKVWPVERFSQVAQTIIDRYGARIVIVGSTRDSAIAEQLHRSLQGPVMNCAGRTTLRQCAALLKNCQLYLGNDTSPMHMAAAFQVPVVAVSAHPADGANYQGICPLRFGPWKTKAFIVQPPAAKGSCAQSGRTANGITYTKWCAAGQPHCILQVSPESVEEAVDEMMDLALCGAGIASSEAVPA